MGYYGGSAWDPAGTCDKIEKNEPLITQKFCAKYIKKLLNYFKAYKTFFIM